MWSADENRFESIEKGIKVLATIVCLGDSITAGYGLRAGENWTDLLQKKHPEIRLINRGISGDTTSGMLARFKRDVIREKPDDVMIFGGLNDFFMEASVDEMVPDQSEVITTTTATLISSEPGISTVFGQPTS